MCTFLDIAASDMQVLPEGDIKTGVRCGELSKFPKNKKEIKIEKSIDK